MDIQNTIPREASIVQVSSKNKQHEETVAKDEAVKKDSETVEKRIAERLEQVKKDKAPTAKQEKSLEKSVTEVNDFFQNEQRKISFSMNEKTGNTIILVKDVETDKVLRQIPADYVVKLAEHLSELQRLDNSSGVLLKELA